MIIFVITSTQPLRINLENSDSIAVLKQKIEQLIKISPSKQILQFKGKILNDKKVLGDYQIHDGYIIRLFQRGKGGQQYNKSKNQVYMTLPDGKPIILDCSQITLVGSLKAKVESLFGFSKNRHRLLVNEKQIGDFQQISQYVDSRFFLKLRGEQSSQKMPNAERKNFEKPNHLQQKKRQRINIGGQSSKDKQLKQQESRQKILADQLRIKMTREIADKEKRIKQLEANIENIKKQEKQQKLLAEPREGPVKRGRPRKQPQRNEVLKGAEFFEMLKNKGVRDQILTILRRHEVESTQILKECSEQMLIQIGIPLAQVILLKKIKQM